MALQPMYPSKPGSPLTSLAEPLAADGTSMTLEDATVLPSAPNIAVIGSDSSAEIVSYTAITGNVVSGLVRALGGTTASAWTTNTAVARNITSYDHDTFKYNIEALNTEKISGVAWGDVTGTLSNQTDLQTALNAKQATYSADATQWDTTPTASSTNPVTSGGIKTYADNKILYFNQQSTSTTSAATSEFCNVSDSRITADTVVLNCEFTVPSVIISGVSITSAAGYISLKGICTSNTCKVNLVLGQKGN
jgi:hypothetical protein